MCHGAQAFVYVYMWVSECVCVIVTTSFLHFLKSLFFLLSSSRCLDGLLFRFPYSCLYVLRHVCTFSIVDFRFIFHSNVMRISWRVCKRVTIQYIGNIDFYSRKIHLKLLEKKKRIQQTPVIIKRKSLNILFDYRFEMITVHRKTELEFVNEKTKIKIKKIRGKQTTTHLSSDTSIKQDILTLSNRPFSIH